MRAGTLVRGEGRAAGFVASVADDLADALGFRPFPGTLNLSGAPTPSGDPAATLAVDDDHCDGVDCYPCRVAGVRAAVIRPLVPDYPPEKTEVVAPVHLRRLFDLSTGDAVPLGGPDDVGVGDRSGDGDRGSTPAIAARASELDAFDAVVFDLDGTLVDLDVDWDVVFADLRDLLDDALDAPVDDYGRDELYAAAREAGRYEALDDLLTRHEAAGVDAAAPRPLLEALSALDCPVGVCTANAATVAEAVLDRFDADVDCVVGRETVPEQKPDPTPLRVCLGDLGVSPGDATFVGDSAADAGAAVAAGTSYHHPDGLRVTDE